jgi:hypothetical protein
MSLILCLALISLVRCTASAVGLVRYVRMYLEMPICRTMYLIQIIRNLAVDNHEGDRKLSRVFVFEFDLK